jgi:hypothetical protein
MYNEVYLKMDELNETSARSSSEFCSIVRNYKEIILQWIQRLIEPTVEYQDSINKMINIKLLEKTTNR